MHWASLNGLHCIQSGSIAPKCKESSAFNAAAWNPLHSIGMHFTSLHGLHCIQSQCLESTAFHREALGHAALNPLEKSIQNNSLKGVTEVKRAMHEQSENINKEMKNI